MEDLSTLKTIKIIYILYLIGLILPFCTLIGLVCAYIYKDDAREYLKTHVQYQIRSFWISLLYYAISLLLCLILIGWVLLFVVALWWIIRNVKGFRHALKQEVIPNMETWLF